MSLELVLTPTGHLWLGQDNSDNGTAPDAWVKKAAAFAASRPEGLFALAARRPEVPPPPSFAFWRDFACRYLTRLCRTPGVEGHPIESVEAPAQAQ
jgi:hypothetical protein